MSNRYETYNWKKEDWEAHNRLQDNSIKRIIEDFHDIKDRIIKTISLRYGKDAKGLEFIKNLFREEFKKFK